MKTNYILLLALLGFSALSMAAATKGRFDGRPTVIIRTNETGIVTLSAVNTAMNQTWRNIQRTWSKTNRTTTRPAMPALASFLDVDALSPWLAGKKGINVTLLGPDAFQVTRTRRTLYNPVVQYLASTTNATNVTGLILVILPKSTWVKVADIEDEEVDAATLNHNFTNPTFNHTIPTFNHTKPTWNFTKPTKPTPQPKPFRSMVNKRIARNESTTTITVADINGGNVKVPAFFGSPDLATLTSAAASKWSWATVGFNATASATSFTVTVNNRKPINWVTVAVTGVSTANATAQGTVSVKITRTKK